LLQAFHNFRSSSFYFAIPEIFISNESKTKKEGVKLLLNYLTSEGVVNRLKKEADINILDSSNLHNNIRILSSITQKLCEPEMQPVLEWIEKAAQ